MTRSGSPVLEPSQFSYQRVATGDGVQLNVLVAGSGPDVLLIHGFPDDHGVWQELLHCLDEQGCRRRH